MMASRTSNYDLHSHTTRSDGVMLPAALVERAASRAVRVLAITDHDDVSGLAEARAAAAGTGIELIDGVEISVSWNDHTLHVVGLRVDPGNEALQQGLRQNRSGRNARAERMAAGLAGIGIAGALEGARRHVTNPELVSRTHFARFLVQAGHARSTHAVFDRYLGTGKPGYVPHAWASLEQATQWIAAAGGVAVLAHPGRYKLDEPDRAELLRRFRDLGGSAVEVVTGSHAPEEFDYWARRAREFGLFASVGSDFHGPRDSSRDLGDLPPLPAGCRPVWQAF
jgi:3',5'-nucleoside bisphosphate phosphatase